MRSLGFHASSGTIRYVVLEGSRKSPTFSQKAKRPLQLIADRTKYAQSARNLFAQVISLTKPDAIGYVLSMNALKQDQLAAIVMPMGLLNGCALDAGLPCREFIAANFSKKFFKDYGIPFTDRYEVCDAVIGVHPPNWTNSERLAALAALGAL